MKAILFPDVAADPARRTLLAALVSAWAATHWPSAWAAPAADFGGDPFKSHPWADMAREFLGADARIEFDPRVQVRGPVTAENPVVVPVSVSAEGVGEVERIVVLVDRNPIRKVLDFEPLAAARPSLSFRFRLEQASPVRAAVRTRDGVWHVGSTWVESAGGGCTVSGVTRTDGTWSQTLGQVSGKLFLAADGPGSRLRVKVMHPMDTGLVGGIPALYIKRLAVIDATGAELLRIATFEPVSENPVFSFDLSGWPAGPLRLVGVDNNGNRIDAAI